MITEDYVSFETAKLLKENGFNENTPVNYFVGDDKPRGCMVGEMIYHKRLEEDTHLIACPTLQMAMKWLREVYGLFVRITEDMTGNVFEWSVYQKNYGCRASTFVEDSYEQACEAAIRYTLKKLI